MTRTTFPAYRPRSSGSEATPDSLYNAIWWADALGRLIRQDVQIVAYFALQSSSNAGSWGLLERYDLRPTYYVYQLYQKFGSTLVQASSDDPDVSIYAARHDDGTLTLIVVNRGSEEETQPLFIEGLEASGSAQVWLLDAEHNAEQVDDIALSEPTSLSFPPQSVTLYVIPGD